MAEQRTSAWMRYVLWAAAGYNLLWGAWVVAFPFAGFDLAGLPRPVYPEIWQCVGMIVGVYGLGYAIASSDPFRHWPIVAVGLTGKILGPIGFLAAALQGRFPWKAGWTIVTNDLIWWVPFAMILRAVYASHLERIRSCSPEVLSFALRARTSTGASIEQLSRISPVLLVFLRHAGCTFCREAVADIARQRREIEAAGTQIVLVHMGEEEFGREFFRKHGLENVPQVSDTRGALYRAFGLPRGSLGMLFGPKVWVRGFQAAILEGHGVGPLAGDGFQMPGIFLLFHGHVLRSYRHQSAADRPDYARFVRRQISEHVG